MLIKTLDGKRVNVEIENTYIKPFYNRNNAVDTYSICSNENNKEVVLASYSDITIAKHMRHLLISCKELKGLTHQVMSEVDLAEDLFLSASYKLRQAKEKYKEEEVVG
ncbi:hypothetical protein FDF74_11645 [Clostridium niameyense]|uniref:Uncharacterized protein n=1 Tax=Clostridium niameyense TaxID=1622073 RepID=A0A6M0RC15_9CLOT|nr:hypothetical protein [Clostridium niameyense]NEZ47835.1 hypothetical protein [Clostridium niameyense]